MARLPQVAFASLIAALGLAGALLLPGCAGGSAYTLDVADLAERFLPSTREVDYHPDSLGALTITEEENKVRIELASDYESLHRRWSSSYQNMGTGRSRRTRSYATFWSKELSLAELQAETAVSTLTRERAQKLLKERQQEYRNALQIDIYWFEAEGNSLLTGPGGRTQLEIGGETYRPARETHGPLREAFLMGGQGALYRRNTFYFPRVVDSTDVLKGSDGMTLTLNRFGAGSRIRFTWEWPPN